MEEKFFRCASANRSDRIDRLRWRPRAKSNNSTYLPLAAYVRRNFKKLHAHDARRARYRTSCSAAVSERRGSKSSHRRSVRKKPTNNQSKNMFVWIFFIYSLFSRVDRGRDDGESEIGQEIRKCILLARCITIIAPREEWWTL